MPAANPPPCLAMVTTACRLQTADCRLQTAQFYFTFGAFLVLFGFLLGSFWCPWALFWRPWALFWGLCAPSRNTDPSGGKLGKNSGSTSRPTLDPVFVIFL